MSRTFSQRGFSLIEMTVAMIIGLFLLGGVLAVEQTVKATYTNQTELTQLQDNERLAMTLLTDIVQSAGYYPDPTSNTPASALPALSLSAATFAAGQSLSGVLDSSSNDTLYVRYMTASADTVILCDGSTNASGSTNTYVNYFYLSNGALYCELGVESLGATPVELVSGIQSMKILYGVKTTTAIADNNVDSYLTAAQVSSAGQWLAVTALQVTLTFTNPLYGQPGQTSKTVSIQKVISLMSRVGVVQ
jgi:type IV pilus assembly protein PilW